ncbi:cytochrome b [Paraburkholderia sp.]|uniref:cytochrome b n=1 Tax=Paraburkholderia sp. TaxID=1926495 RepID=UPI002382B56D|nr:cytochrome b [Paraburkholderia sp.]MDE1179790.1 cytochrome b [Paraburkholderia sp.]
MTTPSAATDAASSPPRYTRIAMSLHWVIAALIVWGFALGWIMTDIPGFTPTKLRYFSWHKWIGVTVLVLAVLRVVWRALNRPPALPAGMHDWEKRAAHAGHALLYLLMLAIPVTGYFYSSAAGIQVVYLGVLPLPKLIGADPAIALVLKKTHIYLNYTLLAVVAGHLLAVVKHQVIDRQKLLSRMLPFGR